MLENLHDHLCGCVYVTGSISIQVSTGWPDATDPLVESNFTFLYHIREIRDYLFLNNVPQVDRVSLPNLRIIRGEGLFSGFSLFMSGSSIASLYMPQLTEITKGNSLVDGTSSLCNVDWDDIHSSGSNMSIPACTVAGEIDCVDFHIPH